MLYARTTQSISGARSGVTVRDEGIEIRCSCARLALVKASTNLDFLHPEFSAEGNVKTVNQETWEAFEAKVKTLSEKYPWPRPGYISPMLGDKQMRHGDFKPIMSAGRRTRPNIARGNSCCLSASKMNSVRLNLNDISTLDQGTLLRTSVSGEPSCPPTSRD